MKKTLITFGTLTAAVAPIAATISCTKKDEQVEPFKSGRIITEYVRAHDIVTSLRLPVYKHARSDIPTTKHRSFEGYLQPFTNPSIGNGKNFSKLDKEEIIKMEVDAFVAKPITDTTGRLDVIPNKIDVKNEDFIQSIDDELLWKEETRHVAKIFDKMSGSQDFSKRAEEIIAAWNIREAQLKQEASALSGDIDVLLVMGEYDSTKKTQIINSVVAPARAHELYMLDNISFPDYNKTLVVPVKSGQGNIYKYSGKTTPKKPTAPSVEEMLNGFAGKVDKIIFLEDPDTKEDTTNRPTDDVIKTKLEGMLKSTSTKADDIIISEYDTWEMALMGGAIGANLAMDLIRENLLNKTPSQPTWKDLYKQSDLKTWNGQKFD